MCSSARSALHMCRSVRTSASATAPRATRRCSAKTSASPRVWRHCWRSKGRSSPPATYEGSCSAGEVEQATSFLGAPFQMRGEVVHGDERGRELGFPTANLIPDDALVCPGHGVYACLADTGDGTAPLPAAVNIGVRPTFDTGRGELVEAYILDFDGDLYGKQLRLDFLSRLRGERRFSSAEALVEQMRRDVRAHARDRRCLLACATAMTITTERKREIAAKFGAGVAGHRQHQGPGGPADRAHQPPDRAPARAEQGPPLAPWPLDARRPSPPLPRLFAAQGPRGLPRSHQGARPP